LMFADASFSDSTFSNYVLFSHILTHLQVVDEDRSKQNVVFHSEDVRIFRRSIHDMREKLVEILPGK
jgi:hypothetical protein